MELANSTESRKDKEMSKYNENMFGGYSSLTDLTGRMPSFAAGMIATAVAAVREGGAAHV